MNWLAGCAAADAVAEVLQAVEQRLAVLQLARIAPRTTASQAHHAIASLVFVSFAESFAHAGRLPEERDPAPAGIDTFGSGRLEREEQPGGEKNRAEEKMRSLATERSKNSFRSGRFALDSSFREPSPSAKGKEGEAKGREGSVREGSLLVSLCEEGEADGAEEKMRQAENERAALESATRRQHLE